MSPSVEKYNQELAEVIENGKLLYHVHTVHSKGMSDHVTCSCGWKSDGFWDGVSYAIGSWKKHTEQAIASGQMVMNF